MKRASHVRKQNQTSSVHFFNLFLNVDTECFYGRMGIVMWYQMHLRVPLFCGGGRETLLLFFLIKCLIL